MAISEDCTKVAISGYKRTTFFSVETGQKITLPVETLFNEEDCSNDYLPELLLSPKFDYGVFEHKFEG